MDLADDVAYSVHDVEDGVVAGRIDLSRLDRDAVWATVRDWYLPGADDAALDEALDGAARRRRLARRAVRREPPPLAALKNLTSDLIGRFCGAVAGGDVRARRRAVRALPRRPGRARRRPRREIGVLKGIAAHYVMQADDRVAADVRQRELLAELVEALAGARPDALERRSPTTGGRRADDAGAPPGGRRPGRVADRRQRASRGTTGWSVGAARAQGRSPCG